MPLLFETREGVKIYVYPKDHKPPHVHALWPRGSNPEKTAKFEIDSLEVLEVEGFSAKDIKRIEKFLKERKGEMKEKWNEQED